MPAPRCPRTWSAIYKANQNHAVDRLETLRISSRHGARRKSAGALNRQLDVAELGQQTTPVGAVAAVGCVKRVHVIEMLIDRLIPIAPFQPLCLHALHQLGEPSVSCGSSPIVALGVLV
jgi:hypothetical protein